jgi:hypothetical protein
MRGRFNFGAPDRTRTYEPFVLRAVRLLVTNQILIAVYQDNKERWNFEFDNGEVWQQIEPRYLPKLESFPVQVDISEGVFGSYDLRAEGFGKVVKVMRLK